MRPGIRRNPLAAAVIVTSLAVIGAANAHAAERFVAVTFDDLPAPSAGIVSNTPTALREHTAKLLAALRARSVPAVGFVNEGKLVVELRSA